MIIKGRKINKRYGDNVVLKDFDIDVFDQEFVIITGASGSGKSTLCNILGLLEEMDSGSLLIKGQDISQFSIKEKQRFLKNEINYLFQNFALLEDKTVLYNLQLVYQTKKERQKHQLDIIDALKQVGLEDCLNKKVYVCSGGQQQRIALARCLLKKGNLLICDEPTGSLDHDNKIMIMNLLKKEQEKGKTIIMVSHDESLFTYANRIIYL
ncbi:ABC transporter ATP-binding protein [Thomasclavelia sp.]|uniref:ABC transporter ATP-binding protein n=1 Tax=Thomasclavelia sp. TaxID=3025757 RepID=UPI0025FF3BD3|nr:ATP-binding cassette domain-containing protein [Thomasclavelia sp.]